MDTPVHVSASYSEDEGMDTPVHVSASYSEGEGMDTPVHAYRFLLWLQYN